MTPKHVLIPREVKDESTDACCTATLGVELAATLFLNDVKYNVIGKTSAPGQDGDIEFTLSLQPSNQRDTFDVLAFIQACAATDPSIADGKC